MPKNFQPVCRNNDVTWYLMELQSRLVANTGIPSDKFHLGKLILQALEDAPDHDLQIDGVTGEVLTFGQAYDQVIQCANAFRNLGLQQRDIVVLAAGNDINISIPYYASFCNGLAVCAIDWTYGINELQHQFEILKPKIVFCMRTKVQDIQAALKCVNITCYVVSFGESNDVMTFERFLSEHGNSATKFQAAEFNSEKTVAVIVPTSGTTGNSKGAAVSHKALFFDEMYLWIYGKQFPIPTRLSLLTSTLQWMSAHLVYVASPLFRFTRLAYSQPTTSKLLTELINKYKPTNALLSTPLLAKLLNSPKCDLSCFEQLLVGGCAVPRDFIRKVKLISPNTQVIVCYGATEFGASHLTDLEDSLGPTTGYIRTRLMDVNTGEEIHEPNKNGELWVKGPSLFEGYYNNLEETAKAFSEDGWFKSGDVLYRDEHGNYHFVERVKLLLNYKNLQVSPMEIEGIILQHPGVADVIVVGLPDPYVGDKAVAFVVRNKGASVSAMDIKDIVKKSLSESKHLHGGVIFIDEIPLTNSTKAHRRQLKLMALTMERE